MIVPFPFKMFMIFLVNNVSPVNPFFQMLCHLGRSEKVLGENAMVEDAGPSTATTSVCW